jgi:hypothetical protein
MHKYRIYFIIIFLHINSNPVLNRFYKEYFIFKFLYLIKIQGFKNDLKRFL